jgi:hypothetical protein
VEQSGEEGARGSTMYASLQKPQSLGLVAPRAAAGATAVFFFAPDPHDRNDKRLDDEEVMIIIDITITIININIKTKTRRNGQPGGGGRKGVLKLPSPPPTPVKLGLSCAGVVLLGWARRTTHTRLSSQPRVTSREEDEEERERDEMDVPF